MQLANLTPMPSLRVRPLRSRRSHLAGALLAAPGSHAADKAAGIQGAPGAVLPTPVCLQVKPPRIQQSAVHLECKLVHTYEVKNRCACFGLRGFRRRCSGAAAERCAPPGKLFAAAGRAG